MGLPMLTSLKFDLDLTANPKSASFGIPLEMSMFAGLISRCIMPIEFR